MKKTIISVAVLASCLTAAAQKPAIARDEALEAKVEQTLARMSLDEKIGQMLQLNLDVAGSIAVENAKVDREKVKSVAQQYGISPQALEQLMKMSDEAIIAQFGQFNVDIYTNDTRRAWKINEVTVDTLISKWKVGSILNAPAGKAPTIKQWQQWISLIQQKSMQHLGIPCIFGLDNNHGVTYIQGGTMFPQPINVAASFNTDVAYTGAKITAYESRTGNTPWVFNPTIDLCRDARWARIWESYGEDAIVNARMVEAAVRGYQGDDNNHLGMYNVATSVKHYFGYGAPFSGKDRTPAYISPLLLREKYFEPFRAAIKAGALTIMVNSASVNGVPLHSSYEYLTKWLKQDLNWDGMIITDWADINNLYTREKVAKDKKDAIRIAINAGIDMSMDPYNIEFCILLKQLVEEGSVKQSRIDDAVRRILRLKYRLGLFDMPNTPDYKHDMKNEKREAKNMAAAMKKSFADYGSAAFAAEALKAAEESEVLLKNDGILPIAKGKKILLVGPNANSMRSLNGGWTYTWQGGNAEDLSAPYNTIYEALCNKYGAENVTLEQGVTYDEKGSYYSENAPEIDKAVNAAKGTDIVIACIGENSYTETPGNLTDITLSENQRNLVKAVAKTGKPIVMVLNEGRPRLVADIEPLANAVVDVLLPGNYGGDALANLLAGDANFSGKLPYTYPKEINSLINYDYKVSEEVGTMAGAYDYNAKVVQQWPFGYGLSYTTYEYSNMRVENSNFAANDNITISLDVKNTGKVAGKESVLLYSSDLMASITPDSRRLRAFQKIELQPGEQKTVTFTLPASALAFVGADGHWVLEEGEFALSAGNQIIKVNCTTTKRWDTPNIED